MLDAPELEAALGERLSFRRFVGLSLDEPTLDDCTLWRFREALGQRPDRARAGPHQGRVRSLEALPWPLALRYMSLARNNVGVLLTLTGWNMTRTAYRLRLA